MRHPSPLFVVSAPSGTGKTTLNRRLVAANPSIEISVSLTTRPPREGERDGVDYYFVSAEEFEQRITKGEMLESATVHGNLYGSSLIELDKIRQRGHTPLLEIDVQGWEQARRKFPSATAIFIMPPSMRTLWERLERRGTDPAEVRLRRLRNARTEIASAQSYNWFIVNDNLDAAYNELHSIIVLGQSGKTGPLEGGKICRRLVNEFDQARWVRELESRIPKRRLP